MLRGFAIASLLGGCDVLFGLSHVDHTADATSDSTQVTGKFHLRYSQNQADLTPALVEDVYPPDMMTMTVRLDDGTTPSVAYLGDGTFTFPLATHGQSYALRVVTPYTNTEYQSSAPHLELADRLAGRPFPAPVTQSTLLQFRLGTPAGTAFVVSTGVWSCTYSGQTDTATFDYDWLMSKAKIAGTQPFGLLDPAENDRLYFIDFGSYGTSADAYAAIYGVGQYTITQVDGMPVPIAAPPVQLVTHDRCMHVVALRTEAATRLQAALPRFTGSGDDWHIWATPDYALANTASVIIAAEDDAAFPSDINIDADYYNPYPGTKVLGSMASTATRMIQLPSTTPVPLTVGGRMWQSVDASASCAASTVVLRSTIGITDTTTLGGTPLSADNQVVSLDLANDIPLTWSASTVTGPIHDSTILLYELVNNAGATGLTLTIPGIVTAGSSARLDKTWFKAGHTYILGIVDQLGLANAATGDFLTLTYPVANMTTFSTTFQVVAQ